MHTHITNDMQGGAAEKIDGFMETATAKPEPPNPLNSNRLKHKKQNKNAEKPPK